MAPKPPRSERQAALDAPFRAAPPEPRFAPGKQDEDGVTYFPLSAVLALAVIAYVFRGELFDVLRALA